MKIGASLTGNLAASLRKFAQSVDERVVRSGTLAGAMVLYDEMHMLASRGEDSDGTLADALYTWHDDEQSVNGRQVYAVGVNKRKAQHWHWIEYGRWRHYRTIKIGGQWVTLKNEPLDNPVWVPASPYIRPAFDAKIITAIEVAKRRMAQVLKEISK